MKQKGFTFVELLAVITIIGIIGLIVTPTLEKMIKENSNKIYNTQLDNIKLSLQNWASDNKELLPEEGILTLTLGNLKSEGYIDYEIRNPKTKKCFDNSMILKIEVKDKITNYSIDEKTIKESDECIIDINKPTIILNGSSIELVEVNEPYYDLGVVAKDKDNNDITSSVKTKITGSGNYIDTTILNNQYIITYTVTSNGKTSKVSRTVKIVDTKKPELKIPGNIILKETEETFNPLEGVTATDNSKEEVEIKVKSNVSLKIPGTYNVTYTAIDKSGNETSKNRIVVVGPYKYKIMEAYDFCINGKQKCPNGTKVKVHVNSKESYDFYVINDTGEYIELIMNKNIGPKVAWISKEDYIKAGGTESDYGEYGNNNKGPLTALNQLEDLTKNWTNIPAYDYTLEDDKPSKLEQQLGISDSKVMYQQIKRTNVRTRMLTLTEVTNLGCEHNQNKNTCPSWLYENLSGGNTVEQPYMYWVSTARSDLPDSGFGVYCQGKHVYYNNVTHNSSGGVRPVIKVSKNT